MKKKKSFALLLSVIIAAMLILACAFLFTPKTAHAEEAHEHSTMTELTARPAGGNLTAGTYYLSENISGNITVSGTVTLCLNGHTITGGGNGSVITVSENASFTLCDCTGNGVITGGTGNVRDVGYIADGGGVYVKENGSFEMTGGTISGNRAEGTAPSGKAIGDGGGVYVNGGSFTMSGGEISDNTASRGGGVGVNNGTFEMKGGTISYNTAAGGAFGGNTGGGVHVNGGTFTMSGGEISENNAASFGGVYVENDGSFKMSGGTISSHTVGGVGVNNGTFKMTGGTISENTADSGGGVFVCDGSFTMSGGTICRNSAANGGGVDTWVTFSATEFIMTGGTISENTSDNGGGVAVEAGTTFTMSGGTVSGNSAPNGGVYVDSASQFELSGTPNITGNKTADESNDTEITKNVYLDSGKITVTGALEKDGNKAQIGIYSTGEVATGFTGENFEGKNPSDYFIPDNDEYGCVTVSDSGTVSIDTHDFAEEWTTDENSHWHACSNCDEKSDEDEHSGTDDDNCTTALNCSVCDYVMKSAELRHLYSGYTTDESQHWRVCINSDCTQTETKENHLVTDDNDCTTRLFCAICSHTIKAAEAEHNYSAAWTTDKNQHWHVCQNTGCNATSTKENHSGTDDNDCTTAVTCSCGYVITAAETAHNYSETWTTDENQHWHVCKNTGCTQTDTKADHEYTENIAIETYLKSAATCTAKAVYYKSCVCGEHGAETFEDGELVAHTPAEAVRENEVAATCNQEGSYNEVVYCSICGEELSRTQKTTDINPDAHNYGQWQNEVAANCTETGTKGHKDCENCEHHFDDKDNEIIDLTIPKNDNHNWEVTIDKAATCTDIGVKTFTCTYNSSHIKSQGFGALGHKEVSDNNAKAPTCTETGLTESTHCSVCETVLVKQKNSCRSRTCRSNG